MSEDWQKEIEVKLMEMKDWERYLAKGGLLEQIMEKVKKLETLFHTTNNKLGEYTLKHSILESVLKEMYLAGIETAKRHIKDIKRFSMDSPDWNIYVVEQWRSIKTYRKALKKLKGEKPG